MIKKIQVFCALILGALVLSGCMSSQEKSSSYSDASSKDLADYTVKRNNFYGFEFLQKPAAIPANAAVQIDPITNGKKYIFADSSNVFSVITAYVKDGKLTRLTLGKSHASASEADKFWHLILDKAEDAYPKGTVVNSGIGAYIRFENSPAEWKEKYSAFKKRRSMENFNVAYHEHLKSIAFDLFAGKDRKIFVTVDYVTEAYQKKRTSKTNHMEQKLKSL